MLLLQVRRRAVAEKGLHPMGLHAVHQPTALGKRPHRGIGWAAGGQVSSPRHPAAGLGPGVGLTPCQGRSQTPQFSPVSNSPSEDGFDPNAGFRLPNRSAQAVGLPVGTVKTPARFLSLSR
jgi:hypothetical protein